jgi:hypothetical protein
MNVIGQPQPVLDKRGEPHVRRFEEQRWLIDNIIRANGIDWETSVRPSRRLRAGARPRRKRPRRPIAK